ncbi:MAG: hypothetical protein LBH16_00990 [Treponema sp.]|jgi:hypothetical protein|nr:hypothetical protein [Treponema sp.]
MEIKIIIETIDQILGPVAKIIGYIGLIVGPIYGVIRITINLYKNRILKLNKDDGYYYRWKDKYPYCPECYEYKNQKAKIKNDKCVECGKVYKYPSVVIEVCPKPASRVDSIMQHIKR